MPNMRKSLQLPVLAFATKLSFSVIKPLFLLGNWLGNPDLHQRIEEEQALHGDILQSSIVDGYNKLSYKTATGFVWTNW